MSVAYRRHVDDLAVDELHALVRVQQTRVRHAVEVLRRYPLPLWPALHL
jgi:hypothetical protein